MDYFKLDDLPMYEFLEIWDNVAKIIEQEQKDYDRQKAEYNEQKSAYSSSKMQMPKIPKF